VTGRSRLARLIDALPLATIAFDGDGEIVTLNPRAELLFGWPAGELSADKIVPEGTHDHLVARTRAGEQISGLEVQRRARDGRLLDLSVFTAPLPDAVGPENGFLFMYEDIGVRRRAERERDEAQLRYRELIEALPLVTYIDEVDENGTNVYTSPQVREVLGWSPEDWAADPKFFERILHPDDRAWVLARLAHANETREPFDEEYRLLHRDGRAVWVHDQSTIVEDALGKPFARGFLLDITERKRLEEQLVQAEKMQAIAHLAGGIAHDFNNMLTGIGGYADRAASASGDPAVLQSVDSIKAAVAEAASLTSRLLAFNTRNVPPQGEIDLNEVIRDSAEMLDRILGEHVDLVLRLGAGLPPVRGEDAQLKQVIVNLALNALDAMDAEGFLTLETSTSDRGAVLRVSDTGRGMDSETRIRAFEPFFTTKAQGEAKGLGLSVVYGVVDSLGGSIDVQSTPGVGTTVEIVLPAAVTEQPAAAPRAEPAGRKVLLVEDRALLRNLVQDALAGSGFEVTAAAGGDEALALDEGFDLLLTDVVMPEMTGPQLARILRAARPGLRVLYVSGYTDDVLDPEELKQPGTSFLRKPFSLAELESRVADLLGTNVN
jgi:two-component system cell cycle sensor histidine kinase/response regulator CckA